MNTSLIYVCAILLLGVVPRISSKPSYDPRAKGYDPTRTRRAIPYALPYYSRGGIIGGFVTSYNNFRRKYNEAKKLCEKESLRKTLDIMAVNSMYQGIDMRIFQILAKFWFKLQNLESYNYLIAEVSRTRGTRRTRPRSE